MKSPQAINRAPPLRRGLRDDQHSTERSPGPRLTGRDRRELGLCDRRLWQFDLRGRGARRIAAHS